MSDNKKIIIATGGTGGHVFPAVSLASYLNKNPVTTAPIASKHDGANIIKGDSFIEAKLFSLLLYFP